MKQTIIERHSLDANGNPTGGNTQGVGMLITWQNGPLGRDAARHEPNGAFVEGVICAAIGRLEHYQRSKFACKDNLEALGHLANALQCLERRTKDREARGVEGSHSP